MILKVKGHLNGCGQHGYSLVSFFFTNQFFKNNFVPVSNLLLLLLLLYVRVELLLDGFLCCKFCCRQSDVVMCIFLVCLPPQWS